jgi:hypothetical protein
MNSVAARDMRVLSDAEIAMVAGGPAPPGGNEGGVDGLVDHGSATWLSPDGAFVRSSMDTPLGTFSTTAFDSDGNGLYDMIWMDLGNDNWICSTDGSSWNACSPPPVEQYIGHFQEPETIEGD